MKELQKRLSQYTRPQEAKKAGFYPYYKVIESPQDSEITIDGKRYLMFGSNSYLGLTNHPKIKQAAKDAIDACGTGASGSRLLNGNFAIHEELDAMLAEFVDKEAALTFSTGFQVNLGVVSCILGRNDFLILDDYDHASIIEGSRLTFAKVLKYKHNDMKSLEKVLQKTKSGQVKLIVVDGVFSMEGDLAPLDEIVALADKYEASIMVDDAHGLGVMGEGGRGTSMHFGLNDKIDLIMGTFSKSFASLGGFIAGDFETINYIKHNARSLLFSAGIPPASAATVIAALKIIKEEPGRIDQLWKNTLYAQNKLRENGFDIGNTQSPVIPIMIGGDIETFLFFNKLLEDGVFINCVVPPAVKKGSSLLRFSLMATHTKEQIDKAIDALVKCKLYFEKQLVINQV
jgi:8-amino-7-oxononanoate synthase